MQSKTSCFNKTIFWKHVTRFWPVWGVYLAILLLDMPIGLLSQREYLASLPAQVQSGVLNSVSAGVLLSFVFAVGMAMAVWSFLYHARSASGAACLPVTRTAHYLSAMLAGLLPLVAAQLVTFLLTALAEASMGLLHLPSLLSWLGASLLILLFFYGFATLCAMLTGNIVVLPAVYMVLNLFGVGLQMLLNGLAGCFVYGMAGFGGGWLTWLSPVVELLQSGLVSSTQAYDAVRQTWFTTGWYFSGWAVVGIYAAVGAVMLVGAWALLQKRRMESAGDVVAVGVLKPVFRWCMGICAGLCFANMMLYVFNLGGETQAQIFAMTALWLIVGAFLGWFIAEMLIRRSFKVFKGGWRGFGGWALCCAVLLLALTALELDVFGYERRQPATERIESVSIYAGGENATLYEPDNIPQALALHKSIIDHKPQQDQCQQKVFFMRDEARQDQLMELQVVSFQITYFLKNGSAVHRLYELPCVAGERDADAYAAQALMNCPEAVRNRKETPFEFTQENVHNGSVSAIMTARECAAAAGYEDVETYVLVEWAGYTRSGAKALPDADRNAALRDAVTEWRYLDASVYDGSEAYWDGKYPMAVREASASDLSIPEVNGAIDWDRVWFNYTLTLTKQEALELYESCVLPDIASNGLGRVWVVTDDEYAATAYAADLEIAARWPEEEDARRMEEYYGFAYTAPDEVRYYYFNTVPTVDSTRTNDWLASHGLRLHTVAETRAAAR